ncbi:hypothetical protein B0H19DRAFT_1270781 [Mycena capillaripes]|nr:hypothetical protein B0H19DRAFT_1270781 [Mycena capillaripes]
MADKAPPEIWTEIGIALTTDAENDGEKIYARELDRLNFSLVSKHMKAICEATPTMWRNVVLQRPSKTVKFRFATTVEYLERHIKLSRSRPLLIAFQLSFGCEANDRNVELFKKIMTVAHRLEEFYMFGHRECSTDRRCAHSVLAEHGRFHSAGQLKVIEVQSWDDSSGVCRVNHRPVLIDPEQLRSILFRAPSKLIVRIAIDIPISYRYLTSMDVLSDLSTQWLTIFERCPQLHTLVWRCADHTLSTGPRTTIMDSLLSFTTQSVVNLPPFIAPHLEQLVVHDATHPFTLSMLNAIVGYDRTSLKVLDLLINPIPNPQVIQVFARCHDLTTFRVSCTEVRTLLYEAIKDRVYYQYWRGPKFRLREVRFARLPPLQSRYGAARDRFAEVVALGVIKDREISFHTQATRLIIRDFLLPFRCWPTSPDAKRLADDNDITPSFLAIVNLEKETWQPYHSTFTMILVTLDHACAHQLIWKGVTFKGRSTGMRIYTHMDPVHGAARLFHALLLLSTALLD